MDQNETNKKKNFVANGIDQVKDHPVAAAIGAGVVGVLTLIGFGIRAIFGGGGNDDDDAGTPSTTD